MVHKTPKVVSGNSNSSLQVENEKMALVEQAKEVLRLEDQALAQLMDRIDLSFVRAVEMMASCQGRVVVTGVGKSGHVGKKIAATLASLGTPAFFMHASEGVHGDLGMITPKDIVLAISYSGESSEVLALLPTLREIGPKIVALTGGLKSTLAQSAEVVLDVSVEQEADPLGLAPTASTTATMAMGDALAIALAAQRGFTKKDFYRFHPGGSLGGKLHGEIEGETDSQER